MCAGGTGKFKINIFGGIPPYNYHAVGQTNNVTYNNTLIVNGIAQTYDIEVSDQSNQTVNTTHTLLDGNTLAISETINGGCNNGSVTITVTPNGGQSPYTYTWYSSEASGPIGTSNSVSGYINNSPISLWVDVRDNNGCTISKTWGFNVNDFTVVTDDNYGGYDMKVTFSNGLENYIEFELYESNSSTGPWTSTGINHNINSNSGEYLFNFPDLNKYYKLISKNGYCTKIIIGYWDLNGWNQI